MKAVYIKLIIAAVLFLAWIALVALKVPGSEDLVSFIKTALEGLGLYHAVTFVPGSSGAVSSLDALQGEAFMAPGSWVAPSVGSTSSAPDASGPLATAPAQPGAAS